MSELSPAQKAIQENRNQPHLDNFQIVLELAKIENRLDVLEVKEAGADVSSDIKSLKDSIIALENGLIDGLAKQVNYLQDKVKELEENCVKVSDSEDVGTVGSVTGDSEVNPINPETPKP